MDTNLLVEMNGKKLKRLAKEMGLTKYSSLRKADLIKLIQKNANDRNDSKVEPPLYFERQRGKNCVIHSFNNGMGKKLVTSETMKRLVDDSYKRYKKLRRGHKKLMSEEIYKSLQRGKNGYSPDVLTIFLQENGIRPRSLNNKKFLYLESLKKIWRDHNPICLILGTIIDVGGYDIHHAIAIRKIKNRFVLLDSMNEKPVYLDNARKFKDVMKIYDVIDVQSMTYEEWDLPETIDCDCDLVVIDIPDSDDEE